MKTINIGKDPHLKKDIKKIQFESKDFPKVQLFNSSDVIAGNPSSNIAVCFIYTWNSDFPPEDIQRLAQKLANYSALTGFWRTTNGGKYALTNILANPNINKLLVLVFNQEDNGHLLVDAIKNLWKNGINEEGIIINSDSPNPKFEQVPEEAIERIRKQVDLAILQNIDKEFDKVEELVKALYQEPKNAVSVSKFQGLQFISNILEKDILYDDGARFDNPYYLDLTAGAKNVKFEQKALVSSIGQAIQSDNLSDAIELVTAFVFKNGSGFVDERGIVNIENRTISITILDPLENIPDGFSESYIKKYVDEFMNGIGDNNEFVYTYHERIFKKWGNQVEKVIEQLKKNNNTRRALISLWDPSNDLGYVSAPCLDFIWTVIRNNRLEFHVVFRSHHIATVTEDGKMVKGEGAFVPNIYALATLQQYIAENLDVERGPLVVTDFSGHLYVNKV